MSKEMLLQRLGKVQQLAEAGKWQRLQQHPLRYLGALLYRHLLYPRFSKGLRLKTPTFFGPQMHIRLPAAMDIFLLGAKTHDSEIRLARLLIHQLNPGDVFVDVGAHYGFYSLLAALLCGDRGKVLALEASPRSFTLLNNNVKGYPQVQALHLAAADRDGELRFYEFPTLFSEYNSSRPGQYDEQDWRSGVQARSVLIPGRRLDALLSERNLLPKLIKIDVEGAEAEVIKGMSALLAQGRIPMIVMEYLAPDRNNEAHRKARNLLEDFAYLPYRIDDQGRLQACQNPDEYLMRRKLESDNLLFCRPL